MISINLTKPSCCQRLAVNLLQSVLVFVIKKEMLSNKGVKLYISTTRCPNPDVYNPTNTLRNKSSTHKAKIIGPKN